MPQTPRWNLPSPDEMDRQLEAIRLSTSAVIARHLNKRLSIPLSKFLAPTWVTPNQITTVHFLLGLIGCGLFTLGTYAAILAGSILFWLSTVLDGCDGEIAKLRGTSSIFGMWYDTISDIVKLIATYPTLAIGLAKLKPEWASLFYGLMWVMVFSISWSMSMIVYLTWGKKGHGKVQIIEAGFDQMIFAIPVVGLIAKRLYFIAKFDFMAFALMLMAWAGYAEFYLYLSALGSPIYVIATTYVAITTSRAFLL